MRDLTPGQPFVGCVVRSYPLSTLIFSCQYHSNEPYSFLRLLLTLSILAIESVIK